MRASTFDGDGALEKQQDVFTNGTTAIKYLDTRNTHPYTELEITEGADGKPTAVQMKIDGQNVTAAAASVGQVLGSALGRALAPNNQFGQIAIGTVAGAIGQKLAQTFAASLQADASKFDLAGAFTDFHISIAGAGAGSVASFLVAELGHALGLTGFQQQLFNASIGTLANGVANKIASDLAHLTFDGAIGAIDWGSAVTGALTEAAGHIEPNIAAVLGSYLGHELEPAQTKEGAVGGQLLGAVGSAIGIALGTGLGAVLNFIVPGIGSLIGTIVGTLIGDAIGSHPHPAAVDTIDQAGDHYGYTHSSVAEGGTYDAPDKMAAATVDIINAYLGAVKGIVLDHSKQTMVGYVTDPDFRYVDGWVPNHHYYSFISPYDAVHRAALDVLQNIEVIGGDLLLKRAHANSPSSIPDPEPEWAGLTTPSSQSGAEKLVSMSADLTVAQDYENYLNNREAINAVMAANPDSAFTAGWIATFARVNDLKLNQVSGSDFLGGLVGYLDSVNKAGLGAVAANATVKQSGSSVTVEIKVPNGTDVPGSLAAFADQTSQSSDATGTTLQLVFSGLNPIGLRLLPAGNTGGNGDNDLWFGNAGAANNFIGSGGHDILVGGAAADTIQGGGGWDFIDGGAGADTLYGGDGNDILRGGKGNDHLYGGAGDDTYVFDRGDGADVIHDDGGSDTLVFGPGITVANISIASSGDDRTVTVRDPANPNAQDTILLHDWANPNNRIEFFKFADGSLWNVAGTGPSTFVIETAGSARLTQAGNNFFFNTAGTGPALKYNGSVVVAGQAGGWVPIGAEQIAGGYEVAWKNPGVDQYTVWATDVNGNFLSYLTGTVSGSSTALKLMESSFHQDLNGDGRIGVVTNVIEAAGSTSLTRLDDNFYLYSGGSGPSLKSSGADFAAGQFGGWVPIGAEQIAGGYEVAWKNSGADQYTVWSTDVNGNFLSYLAGTVSGDSLALKSLEPSFHQDLNGDGFIGIVTTLIEGSGSTSFSKVNNNFYLTSGGSGPSLKFFGADYDARQLGAWVPVGAEQTAGGYEVAWKNPGTGQYSIWNTDSSGNYISYTLMAGDSLALESLEPTFQQDLNGDGIVGIPFIEGFGSTGLAVADHIYYLLSGGSGPSLKYFGAAVGFGQSGAFAPISAERTATGYDVAWKIPGADQYTVWNTDADGNYLTNITGVVSGSSLALESLETTFQQDLNSDGIVGIPFIEGFGSTGLAFADHIYYLLSAGSGPSLKYFGAPVAGPLGGYVPISAERTAAGYDVAWKIPGSDQYTVWSTGADGNYMTNVVGAVSGSSLALESLETTFQQDLNGDGIVGIPFIEGFGSTGLAFADHIYYLLSGGSGPSLKYFGAPIAGPSGGYVPISAEQTSTGYDVAWKIPGADQYTVWSTGADGNYISNIVGAVSGSSLALESLESTFQQDLNSDGIVGIPFIEGFGSTGLAVADHIYYLLSGGSGPSLKYFGATVGFGQSGAFAPIAAERTATGYDVAWKAIGADQYTVWSTDAAGNYLTHLVGVVYGSSLDLKILEPTFQQDLNGDGVIGTASAVIEGFGSTSLTVADHIYYLTSGGSGPSLKYLGATVGFGETGAFAPIAAEQTATGYDVAWKVIGADQYTVWSTDAAGNYISNITGVVPGNSSDLKSLEGTFHQDLNGDGIIGGSPVILDLDGNGIDITPLKLSLASFDMDGEAGREHTAWAGNNDGLLAIDLGAGGKPGPDGVIDQTAEIVFTQWSPGATSDMAALREVFDTNHNGSLDHGDARWSEFRVWQDANGDGVSQAGEVKTLDAWGIASIGLEPAGPARLFSDGSAIQGFSSFTRTDGTTGAAGDVSLAYQHGAADTPGMMAPAFGDMIWHHVDGTAATLESEPINPTSLPALHNDWHIA